MTRHTAATRGPVRVSPGAHAPVVHESATRDTFREDILAGLARAQKQTEPRHLYDAAGSDLFDRICELPEYYLTRTEAAIFNECLDEVAKSLGGGVTLIEPGAGTGEKAERLLEALPSPRAFVPIEISRTFLAASAERVAERFPDLSVHPSCADFSASAPLPQSLPAEGRVVFFPGSTIGNFPRARRPALLRDFADMLPERGRLLIGFDLVKDPAIIENAYNDGAGVTAEFNLNLLRRINRELAGSFDLDAFEHDAPWVEEQSRIEMRLISRREQTVRVADQTFPFQRGEHIHTESSHKFTIEGFDEEAARAGFTRIRHWTDPREWFCVALYEHTGNGADSRPGK